MQSSLLRQGEKVPLKTFPVSIMFNYKTWTFPPKIEVFVQRNQKAGKLRGTNDKSNLRAYQNFMGVVGWCDGAG